MPVGVAAAPAVAVVGGELFGGWRVAAHEHVPRAGSDGVGRVLVGIVLAMVVCGALVMIRLMNNPLRHPRLRLTAAFPDRRLDDIGISVGPWQTRGWGPPVEVVVLLSGGPLPVETGDWVRWMHNGDTLRLGPGPTYLEARPLRSDGVWIHMCADATPEEDPAALR